MANHTEDPNVLKSVISGLVDIVEGFQRNLDSAIHVAMRVPDWKRLYLEALDDPLLKEHSRQQMVPLKLAVAAVLEGRESSPNVCEALQALKARAN